MAHLSNNKVLPYGDHVYLIGSNVCSNFAFGAIGSVDEFFLVAATPAPDSNYPLITGNFLDSEGNVLFRLVRNTLVVNPGRCSRILSDQVQYEIHDADDELILRVATRFETLPGGTEEIWVTTIEGRFFDSNGDLVVEANGQKGFVETEIGCVFGFSGRGFALNLGMPEQLQSVAAIALGSGGSIFEPVSGEQRNTTIDLSGKIIMPDADIQECTLKLRDGNFSRLGGKIRNCRVNVEGEAANIANMLGVEMLEQQD
ncbi:MAG: hypothetical protein DWQ47_11660 [Acidobacteria bacterium]|nr:MAG: hypothetical protein DWQ32_14075 [Acidobacteriota bacterium]REJ98232.1 MAG: hypothetical protein DWQ38_16875 [Acidobacteriota bacterium]REK16976.1 MAG: hypothetical protein DWQ43_01920 [Acidobacteriota bacterium]REK42886.1 MAG: hypothetical protein DWQ47_11660 [Acidobacteriota bacterium]